MHQRNTHIVDVSSLENEMFPITLLHEFQNSKALDSNSGFLNLEMLLSFSKLIFPLPKMGITQSPTLFGFVGYKCYKMKNF